MIPETPVTYVICCAIVFSACGLAAASRDREEIRGNISLSGAFAIYPLMTRWAKEIHRIHPGIRFDISSGGAGKGVEDVLAGKVGIGMVSREITSEERTQGIQPLPIDKDAVFALVNEDNPVLNELMAQGVSWEILTKLFITGEIATWGEVIGDTSINEEIQVYTRQDICRAAAVWGAFLGGTQRDLLGKGKFGDPGMVQAIQADPEEILDTCEKAANAIMSGHYPAQPSRVLYLVTNRPPEGIVKAFLEWVLADGQAYVERSEYIRLLED